MTTRSSESFAPLILLALLAACRMDSTAPRFQPEAVGPPTIGLVANGYPNSWEAVGVGGTTLSDHTFGVSTHDGISPVSGVQIVWVVSGIGGSVTPATDTTREGRSTATLTLGPEEGAYTLTATAPTIRGAPQLTFNATAVTLMVGARDLGDGGFVPASVTVPAGRSVGWRYESGEGDIHNITFEDDPTRPVSSGDLWDLWSGRRYHSRLFEGSPRTIRYRCKYHSTSFVDGEVGTVTVK
jgi:plastocyanin